MSPIGLCDDLIMHMFVLGLHLILEFLFNCLFYDMFVGAISNTSSMTERNCTLVHPKDLAVFTQTFRDPGNE